MGNTCWHRSLDLSIRHCYCAMRISCSKIASCATRGRAVCGERMANARRGPISARSEDGLHRDGVSAYEKQGARFVKRYGLRAWMTKTSAPSLPRQRL